MRVQQKNRNATMLRFFGHYPDPRRIEKPDGSRPLGFYSPKRVRALFPSDFMPLYRAPVPHLSVGMPAQPAVQDSDSRDEF